MEKLVDGEYCVQYNGFRKLRPGGVPPKLGQQPDLPVGTKECRFYCQEPSHPLSLLRREKLAEVNLKNFRWGAYYNLAPIEKEGHFLWVPVSSSQAVLEIPHIPQALTAVLLEDAIDLFKRCRNLIIFFNSLHAGATVDHLHLQAVCYKGKLPIQKALVKKEGNFSFLEHYPINALVFDDSNVYKLKGVVSNLQTNKIPFNLIFIDNCAYLVPRNPAHEVVQEFPQGVLSSMEVCGKLILTDKKLYEKVEEHLIKSAMRKLSLSTAQIANLL